ncbi:hypothetical protein [Nonomuraea sp. NPDC049158]|uniref:hypothetical protein n=1 Tax=Nonomuraea sp. NPDC049158 TaxID=3155649 RepID=UPI0033CE2C24
METVHEWAQLDDFICITWVSGSALQDIVRVFGVRDDVAQAPAVTVRDEAEDILARRPVGPRLLTRTGQTWTTLLEMRSCRGADDGVLAATSRSGQALNIVADEHGTHITYAINGRITHAFDAEDVGREEFSEDSEMRGIQEWSRGLGVDAREWAVHPKSAAFILAEAITGTTVDDSWVVGDWIGVRLGGPPVIDDSVVLPYEDMRELARLRPDIRAFVDAPGVDLIPAMKNMLARFGVARAELSHPVIMAALEALDDRPSHERLELLRDDLRMLDQEFRQDVDAGADVETIVRWITATQALEAALDPSTSSLSYLACASRVRSLPLAGEERLILETFDVINAHVDKKIRRQDI